MKHEHVDNSDYPSYLAHYNMQRAPFASHIEDDMYYAEPTRSQRMDILLHLTQYGDQLLFLTGPRGVGKTSLVRQYMHKIGDGWKACYISAHSKTSISQIITRINRDFSFPEANSQVENAEIIVKRRLDALLATTPTTVLIIDNAHQIAVDVLGFLLELANVRNPGSGSALKIILCCESQIKINLAAPELQDKQKLTQRKIDLPNLSEAETGELIHHRLNLAGMSNHSIFTDAAINKIFKQTDGNPEQIINLAHRVLYEMTPLKRRIRIGGNSEANHASKFNAIAIGTLVSLVIVMLLVFQDKINRLFQDGNGIARDQISIEEKTMQTLDLPNSSYPSAYQEEDDEVEDDFPDSETSSKANFADMDSTKEKPSTTEKAVPKGFSSRSPETVRRTPFRVKPAVGNSPNPTKFAQPPRNTIEIMPSTVAKQFSINRENWILQQNPNHYTLQLLAGYNTDTIEKFIKATDINESKMAYFFSTNKGKDWHSLVYGIYPDHRSALAASKTLLKSMGTIKPWIRQLKNVQKDIKPDSG